MWAVSADGDACRFNQRGPAAWLASSPLPRTTQVLQATRVVQALYDTDLPRVLEHALSLQAEAAQWCVAGLLFVLRAHLAAASALRFELLVATSLRGAPGRSSETTFRLQVEEVSACTEVTWAQVREAFAQENRADSLPAAVVDFVMGSRPLQRAAADAAEGLAQARADASTHGCELGHAAPILLAKLDEAQRRMDRVVSVCAHAQMVQRAAYRAADARRLLAVASRELGRALQGGLLARLATVVASDVLMPADELQLAMEARTVLQSALERAITSAEDARVAQEALLTVLEAMPPELQMPDAEEGSEADRP
jgi:hypothetical protein